MRPWLLMLLLMALPATAQPPTPYDCEGSAVHRAFDFWLGNWEVRDAEGALAGTNTIRKIQKGCALEEQWQSVRGGTGQSVNYYDPAAGQWRQLWHDAGASIIDIRGEPAENTMVLTGSIYYLNNATSHPFRGTWTPMADGRVRQHFEQQDAQGSWQTWFDGYYTRSSTGKRE